MTKSKLQKVVGEQVLKYRKSAKLSQEQLAEHLGVHRTYAASIERGERNLSLKTLEQLAERLGVTPEYLLDMEH